MRSIVLLAAALLLLTTSSCSCGDPVVAFDVFGADQDPPTDALHTYASHAQVPMKVKSTSWFASADDFKPPTASGSLSIDPDTEVTHKSGVLSFALLTGDAGTGTLTINDANGSALTTRSLKVVDADAISFAVTAPKTSGVDLPDVDITKVRIDIGGTAAFRTTLHNGADEIVGLQATTSTPADASLSTRNGVGCASDTCAAVRNAYAVTVPATTADESDITVAAGDASATLHIVPTADADITDLVLDQSDVVSGQGSIVGHVLAGAEPVFGAPVVWSVDGATLDNDDGTHKTGDVLQFSVAAPNSNKNLKPESHDVSAAFAGQQGAATVLAEKDSFGVTSITAACGAAPSSSAALFALLTLLRLRSRRRIAYSPAAGAVDVEAPTFANARTNSALALAADVVLSGVSSHPRAPGRPLRARQRDSSASLLLVHQEARHRSCRDGACGSLAAAEHAGWRGALCE
ncbi:MAG TPA: hypothetical protein VGO62_00435 [Myxococcota bacterium]|jgi:hypothetical protein